MDNGKDLPGLAAWADRMQLTDGEAAAIRQAILATDPVPRDYWLERLTSRIELTMARNRRRLDQAIGYRQSQVR